MCVIKHAAIVALDATREPHSAHDCVAYLLGAQLADGGLTPGELLRSFENLYVLKFDRNTH